MRKRIFRHFKLTFFFSLTMFLLQFVAISVAGIAIYIMVRIGMISVSENSSGTILHPLIYMALISLVTGLICSVFASKIPLGPFYRLIEQMNRLAAGDFRVRLDFGGLLSENPVFGGLSESFNKMADELEHTEMLRSDFINNFSHEFKTPIVSIAGFAKLVRKGGLTKEQQAEYLAIIEEESIRLASMATNVLNLTRVENQAILTDISSFNISEQLRSCILLLADKWEKKNINFKVDFKEYMVSGNEELLKQVWINLIDNAIKFSPEGGEVELRIVEDDRTISVSIINAGKEIPSEEQGRIFNKFYQADTSHSAEGNGIGLAVARRVIELHEGVISVESENGLTMFSVKLPVKT